MMQHNSDDFDRSVILISDRAIERRERAIDERRISEQRLNAAAVHAADDSPWLAFRVMSGHELAVENAMRQVGIECLVPMRKGRELRRRHRVVLPVIPVMVGYVLVRFEPSVDAFNGVSQMEYVIGVIGGATSPRWISDNEIKAFEQRAREGYFDWSRRFTAIRRGSRVVIVHGPFKGATGAIVSSRSDGLGDAVVEFDDRDGFPTAALLPLAILEKL